MARTIKQTSANPDLSYEQVTTGDTPNSVEVSLNAKGQAQPTVKLTYATPAEMEARVADDMERILSQIEAALTRRNIPLAGRG